MKSKNLFDIKNKLILVFGGSSGIGKSIGQAMAHNGAIVIFIGRKLHNQKNYFNCDVNEEQKIKSTITNIRKNYGRFDAIINSVGITDHDSLKSNNKNLQHPKIFSKILTTNLISIYNICYHSKSYLKKNASIINISSISSYFGFPNNPGYVSSKSGLSGLTRSLAYDFSKKNIRVNNIVPGYIRTEMTKKSFNNKKLFNLRKSSTLLNKWGNPKDIIGACTFLVSSSSSYITGADIVIDGGWSVKGI